ncbi:MAG: HIT domain-containing protein [Candidatus Binatia bacterium]|nr:HIT domain-containing protein [Candidatus Binatia bacterium]
MDKRKRRLPTRNQGEGEVVEVLWAPWRGVYLSGPKDPTCIFCRARDANDPAEQYVLSTSPAVVMLNKFPYATAHLMVAPRRHTADFAGMPAEEACELLKVVQRAAVVLQEVYKPEGMNIGLNLGQAAGAGFVDHLHWHLVPRWIGDTNFMPVLAGVKVMPDHLQAIYEKLKPHFAGE